MKCNKCSRVMRAQGMLKADYPGTVASGARGLCSSCYAKALKAENPTPKRESQAQLDKDMDRNSGPCVPVRIDLTPATFKALRLRGVNISSLLSRAADHIVKGMDNA